MANTVAPGPTEAPPVAIDPRLAVWERRMNPWIIAAAIAPIAIGLTKQNESDPAEWLDVISWLVFLADLLVHLRWHPRYLRTNLGRFDLGLVIITAPWFLIPGLGNLRILGLARLSRLARVFLVSTKSPIVKELGQRLGKAALYGLILMVCCALVVYGVEPDSSGFATFGDSMWWAIVTFTTVGYGDLYPVTRPGRFAAVLLMIGGVALIGTLAGSLGSFFSEEDATDQPAPSGTTTLDDDTASLLAEVRLLRTEFAELRSQLPPATD